jgi:hypothetical protein
MGKTLPMDVKVVIVIYYPDGGCRHAWVPKDRCHDLRRLDKELRWATSCLDRLRFTGQIDRYAVLVDASMSVN